MALVKERFDEEFYLQQAPELREQVSESILRHFVEIGWRAMLDPAADFSTELYLQHNSDVRESGMNPLTHHLVTGRSEGRQAFSSHKQQDVSEPEPAPVREEATSVAIDSVELPREIFEALRDPKIFDADYYRESYGIVGDDVAVVADFLTHPERAASPYFDPEYYAAQNFNLGSGAFAALKHYLTIGKAKNLRPSRIFDGVTINMTFDEIETIIAASGLFQQDWYEYHHSDVVKAGTNPLKHYSLVGDREYKRTPNALFDNKFYLQQAIEVRTLKWHPLVHYILLGSKKGLSTHVLFDAKWFSSIRPSTGSGRTPLGWLFEKAMAEGIGPNEFFDPIHYARVAPHALNFPGGLVAHYMEEGWLQGLDPSKRFSTKMYLAANPDVREKKSNPLHHFMNSGRMEGRDPNPFPTNVPTTLERFGDPEYGAVGPLLYYDLETDLPPNFAQSIAVHLHLYYVDMLDEFCRYLSNIPARFHLFVSTQPGRGDLEALRAAFVERLENCDGVTVAAPENRGRDVAPFLIEFGKAILTYDLVLHLHSKRSPHSPKHAGWRRYLFHYTLANRSTVTQILTSFHADPHLGVFQPPYHPEIRAQPKWGGNRDVVISLLNRFGLSYLGDTCPHFPAGSFFWARTDALRPLLEGRLCLEDFDEEAGQIDGTLAHAIERLFGLIPVLRGYSVVSRFTDIGFNLVNYYGKSRAYPQFESDRTQEILDYQHAVRKRGAKRGRIAVVTAIIGSFDALLLPNRLEPEIDYFCVTDSVTDGYGVFRLLPCPYLDADPRRSARYVKTNLLRLFPGYDFVVWVDANVLVRRNISDFVAVTQASGLLVGAIAHPIRRNYLEEATEAFSLNLDDSDVIAAQISRYESVEALGEANLIETNFMVFDARNPKTRLFQQIWWNEINRDSRRDQLSVNYSLFQAGIEWKPLLPDYMSTRDSDDFAIFRHGVNEWGPKPHIYANWHEPNRLDGHLLPLPELHHWSRTAGNLELDVVVCVYNALEDVKLCLTSVAAALDQRGRIIIVDDASGDETAAYLQNFAAQTGATLLRHEERTGYTIAVNDGIRAGEARNVLLLNSDTIVPAGALNKLSDALDRDPLLGIVGPLSNAASAQSVPSAAGSGSQTAINPVPPEMTIADMDLFFERHWDGVLIRTPLVHGFCFCVKRAVFELIGSFDEELFPRGYGEENDFCFRAADAGFDLAVLASTYIFHAKSKSYGDQERTELMHEGMRVLVRKYGKPRISRSVATMNAQPGLERARNLVAPLFEAKVPAAPRARGRLFVAPALRTDGIPAGSGFVRALLPYRTAAICQRWEVFQLRSAHLPSLGPADAVLVQRDASLIESGRVASWIAEVRQTGARLIYEIDDDLLDRQALKTRGYCGDVEELGSRVMAFARDADAVTVSSEALLKKFTRLNKHVKFIPNVLDADLWRLREGEPSTLRQPESRVRGRRIIIGYIGTPTHDEDLEIVRHAIMDLQKRFPGLIDFQVVGGFRNAKNAFGSVIPLPLANDYPSFVRWLQKSVCWDIGIAPLVANSFNANKSYLKFLECGALGMAMVCSKGPEFARVVKDGETGLLIENNRKAWLSALSGLVRNHEKRIGLARNVFDEVRRHHTLDNLADVILEVLDGQRDAAEPARGFMTAGAHGANVVV
ncbi:rhamnan synthesis F family protein [uncultured Rhodoblastus sp.]|uniref:rhamnan synthesis F family protein n=1 Tax=uncultured Rhodoblastus sp. TaxID=543037 RepID=UPI0025FEF881|nr:rhamnan synthesis F family protein [uncultured Rhodoblastus sp.]